MVFHGLDTVVCGLWDLWVVLSNDDLRFRTVRGLKDILKSGVLGGLNLLFRTSPEELTDEEGRD